MPGTLQRLPAIPASRKADPHPSTEVRTLIDQLIAEQKTLQTPIARYSDYHDAAPDLAEHYRTLIPLTKPREGEQYAFEVALDRCTGCKACVSACHSLNGLDDEEAWRDVGMIHGGSATPGWQQTVTTACHHCEDPGCMNGCPVGAYEKDRDTGIVRHLDDQCIGCSYCILKCPFDVPKYSAKRGIVRKCDMCHQRLAEGEAPACVQSCPTEAIRIVKVRTGASAIPQDFLPGAPDPTITRPTTRYVGREVPQGAIAADREALVPEHAHWPLVLMLMLTQAGVGMLLGGIGMGNTATAILGNVLFFAGMGASLLHLGQPLKAWRFFLGLRTSWLSREILAFSMFAPVPMVIAALPFAPDFPYKDLTARIAALSAPPLGLLAVFTSVMIYHDTRRTSWRFPLTAARFFGTVASFAALGHALASPSPLAMMLFALAVIAKIIPEARIAHLANDRNAPWSPDLHTARLQRGPLGRIYEGRMILAITAVAVALIQPWLSLPLLLIAELLERQLFFQSVHAPKMPGNFGPRRHH
ncbi:dimethyl sulfoxide reductase anchor subunit [Luteolibacter flavescens]|uniref:Dimethyl sulfoxide reductase anchor subunit n=1 Tax=Luteolibacter flavescens TaxID=1859460 RepID=A0ABT3FMS5_9BACT|nr:DmsC/YnfH family molybdoenzyme membrane anchor subunit [Luteolibacter flavescens]MCW1884863.1 dimethyl sulfoxide reductase anchor subunit [Luteolibacter flavescens]